MPHITGKKVKIVATLGPASSSKEIISGLVREGVNVFRINLSHSSAEDAVQLVNRIRSIERVFKRPIAILADLAGPKIRIGMVPKDTILQPGDFIRIARHVKELSRDVISVNFPGIIQHLKEGSVIYLGDGAIKLVVTGRLDNGVKARILAGGLLLSRMGFAVEGLGIQKFSLLPKTKKDVRVMSRAGVDAFAVSFVQTAHDMEMIRQLLPKENQPMLIAKIETHASVHNAEAILDVSDGLMIARGDLGFSIPMAELPFVQKELIALALKKAKPVITATQMLESMINNHLPTRAEVTDVSNAILDGTDAVMFSAETAIGKFPEEVVRTAVKIIKTAITHITPREFPESDMTADAINAAVGKIADQVKAKLIIVFTVTGAAARHIARHRQQQPIIALSPNNATARRLSFSWGISPEYVVVKRDFAGMLTSSHQAARFNRVNCLKKGDRFVISCGLPFAQSGTTNMVLVEEVK
ncbi:MAG: pyruvate kinase [bacterium]|nr:pyruvate kinase [bacterium]